jgi:hypothetical protein
MWERVAAAEGGSTERLALEQLLSIEEAFADAYAFVYLRDTHPQLYDEMLLTMQNLRHDPTFATPFYQVDPLYLQLKSQGFNDKLPWHDQVQTVILSKLSLTAWPWPGALVFSAPPFTICAQWRTSLAYERDNTLNAGDLPLKSP